MSDPKIIRCSSTPYFQLNIYTGEYNDYLLKSTYLSVGIDYIANAQDAEKEPLNEFYITIKDTKDNEIFRSDIVYDINSNVEINNLENKNTYNVQAYGKTVNGMLLISDAVTVNVDYMECNDSSVLNAENNYKNGYVQLKSSIDSILYKTEKPPQYNPTLDLSDNTLEYYSGFNITGDFSIFFKYRPMAANSVILNINNGEIKLNFKTNTLASNSLYSALYEPYFEFFTKDKMTIVGINESGNKFEQIDTSTYSMSSYGYDIKISRENNEFHIKIKDWRE